MFPRADGILLGGTFERNRWETVPEPATIERIVESHRDCSPDFAVLRDRRHSGESRNP
jgi:hypothetical protein